MNKIKTLVKNNEGIAIIAFVISFFAIAGFVVPLLIMLACKGLLYMLNEPIISIAVIGAFILGMLFNELAGRLDRK